MYRLAIGVSSGYRRCRPVRMVPLARPAIVTALNRFARTGTYESWLINEEEGALREAVCLADDLPQTGAIALDQLLP